MEKIATKLKAFRRKVAEIGEAMGSRRSKQLRSNADLEAALDHSNSEPVLVFKHSKVCGLSTMAQREVDRLTDRADPPVYRIIVQDARDISDHIEQFFGIRHETPQAILLHHGEPVFNSSHSGVTADAVRQAAVRAVSEREK